MVIKRVMRTLMKETHLLMCSWRAHVSQGQAKQGGMCRLAQPLQVLYVKQAKPLSCPSKAFLALTQLHS